MTPIPPENLEALKRLSMEIQNKSHEVRLNERNQALLKYMLDTPGETAAKSISELAQEREINTSTITRLAQKLGFKGFPELKQLFRDHLKGRKRFYSDHVKTYLEKVSQQPKDEDSTLKQVIRDEWSNVMLTTEAFDKERFSRIIDLMVNADRILIVGLRGSYAVAHYLGYYLKMIRQNVSLIGQAGHTLADDLAVLKPNDLLLAISISPYTKATVEACKMGRLNQADLVVITDRLSSPLILHTDDYLITPAESGYFFNPLVSVMICIETLLLELVKKLGATAVEQLKHTEYIMEKLEAETP